MQKNQTNAAYARQTELFRAIGEVDPAFVAQADTVKIKKIPLWAKYSSLAACLLVVIAAAIFISGLLGVDTPVYADTTQLNPPIFDLHWGMKKEEVYDVLKNEDGFLSKPDDTMYSLFNWRGTVFGVPTRVGATENDFVNTITFYFSHACSFNGVSYPSSLISVQILVDSTDLQATADTIAENLKISYEKKSENDYYFFATPSMDTITKEQFYSLYNLQMKNPGLFSNPWTKEDTDRWWEAADEDIELQHEFFPMLHLHQIEDETLGTQTMLYFYGAMEAYHPYVK